MSETLSEAVRVQFLKDIHRLSKAPVPDEFRVTIEEFLEGYDELIQAFADERVHWTREQFGGPEEGDDE